MNKQYQVRQGDIFPISIEKLPKDVKKKKDNVLVHSDSTQHDHTLVKGTVYVDKNGNLFAEVPVKTQIVHTADHKPIDLPKGVYEIRRQKEYVMGDMTKIVID